jgi:integrase
MEWHSTKFRGVRFREHPTRKHGVKRDRYFAIRYQKDGKRVEEGIGWTTEVDPEDGQNWTEEKAALVLARLKGAARQGTTEAPTRISEQRAIEEKRREEEKEAEEQLERDAVTFGEFFLSTYLPQCKADKKQQTAKREEGFFRNYFEAILAGLPLKNISPFHVERLKKAMSERGQSPRSIEYALAVLRQVFNMARRLGLYPGESPTANVTKPKIDNSRMRYLTKQEAQDLLEALKKRSKDVHDMTLLALHTGLRFGEIASLTWQDVDLDRHALTIRAAKAGSRFSFLTEQAVEMFRTRDKGNPADLVFPDRNGKKSGKISNVFSRTVDELGLNNGIEDPRLRVCYHTCRHSYAAWLIDAGQDLYTVQKLLGHKTNAMTQRYAHLSEGKLKGAAQALSAAMKTNEGTGQVVNLTK